MDPDYLAVGGHCRGYFLSISYYHRQCQKNLRAAGCLRVISVPVGSYRLSHGFLVIVEEQGKGVGQLPLGRQLGAAAGGAQQEQLWGLWGNGVGLQTIIKAGWVELAP